MIFRAQSMGLASGSIQGLTPSPLVDVILAGRDTD